MNRTEQILKLAKENRIIQANDLEPLGIARNYLYKLCKEGLLIKTARGMYMLPDAPITENQNFIEIAKKIPNAVVCLISALAFMGLQPRYHMKSGLQFRETHGVQVWIILRCTTQF